VARLMAFNQVSLDGYFVDSNGDMSWAHKDDDEWRAFAASNAGGGGRLLFGRITYELMQSYWTTPVAMQNEPVVAESMNNLPKIVFSRTLEQPTWNNTRIINGDLAHEVRKLKQEPEPDIAILGSGNIIAQLAGTGLIDEYQVVINPIALGGGRTMFEGIKEKLTLKPMLTRTFANGNVLIRYEPS
jgi:dihydrofolate reductase